LVTIPATARSARAPHAVISARAAGSPSLSRRSTEENESCGLAGGKDASRLFVHPLVGVSSPGPGGFRMTDRRFYLLLTLLVLTLAAGEVVYAMVGPLSAPTHQVDDLSSINRVRWTIPVRPRVRPWPVEIINEKTIADFTQCGWADRNLGAQAGGWNELISEHPSFQPPLSHRISIWRYMDLAKFLWMLEHGALYFCRADLLGDPYEGYYTEPEVKLDEKAAFAHLRKQIVAITRSMYVNCWHMNDSESAAMWKLYTSHHQSVCVRSTYELLSQVLPGECMLGCIKYIDYSMDLIDRSIVLNYITHKRKSFEHEKEVRAVFWDTSIILKIDAPLPAADVRKPDRSECPEYVPASNPARAAYALGSYPSHVFRESNCFADSLLAWATVACRYSQQPTARV
jgi:hypothetical protein